MSSTATAIDESATVGPEAFKNLSGWAVKPRKVIRGKTFTQTVNVQESFLAYEDCVFDAKGWRHCVKVWPGARFTQFKNCKFTGADSKGLVGEFMSVRFCTFEGLGEDGVFVTDGGHVDVIGCIFRELGWLPGAHSDPFQVVVGSNCRFLGNHVTVPHEGDIGGALSNSCCYIKSVPALGPPPSNILIAKNILDGGLYSVRITASPGAELPSDIIVRGNEFRRHYFGAFTADQGLAWMIPLVEKHNDMSRAERYRP